MSYAALPAFLLGVLMQFLASKCVAPRTSILCSASVIASSIYRRRASWRCIAPDRAFTMPATADICRTRRECSLEQS